MSDTSAHRALPGLAFPEEHLKRLAQDLTVKFAGIFPCSRSWH